MQKELPGFLHSAVIGGRWQSGHWCGGKNIRAFKLSVSNLSLTGVFSWSIIKAFWGSVFLFCKINIIPRPKTYTLVYTGWNTVCPASFLSTWQPKQINFFPLSIYVHGLSISMFLNRLFLLPSISIFLMSVCLKLASFASPSLNTLPKSNFPQFHWTEVLSLLSVFQPPLGVLDGI